MCFNMASHCGVDFETTIALRFATKLPVTL